MYLVESLTQLTLEADKLTKISETTKQEVKAHLGRPLFDQPPPNMFVVNGESDAENLLEDYEKDFLVLREKD